ncbi:MAG: glycosyltransferase [Bacteroidaceae bacterium]
MIPTLSIIVPVYRVEAHLAACIESILSQSYTNFELLLVNDGSPDTCGDICEQYAAKDKRIKVIHQENGGLSAARNSGIEQAKGIYITFVDSDDTIAPHTYLSNMQLLLNDSSIDLLEYPAHIHYQSPNSYILSEPTFHANSNRVLYEKWMAQKGYTHTYAWNKIYKRKLFATTRFPVGKIFEDVYLIWKILDQVNHYYYSDKGMYYYFSRPGSITQAATGKDLEDLLTANIALFTHVKDKVDESKDLTTLYLYILNIQIDVLRKGSKSLQIPIRKVSYSDLFHANLSLRTKIKNIFLPLLGIRRHCRLMKMLHR